MGSFLLTQVTLSLLGGWGKVGETVFKNYQNTSREGAFEKRHPFQKAMVNAGPAEEEVYGAAVSAGPFISSFNFHFYQDHLSSLLTVLA